jgi:hypothetical protein
MRGEMNHMRDNMRIHTEWSNEWMRGEMDCLREEMQVLVLELAKVRDAESR